MNPIRKYIQEKFFAITRPDDREAMEKYGFWLDPAETLVMDGVKLYRVIHPHSVKGGWAPNYETPIPQHIPAEAHINTLKYSKSQTDKFQ